MSRPEIPAGIAAPVGELPAGVASSAAAVPAEPGERLVFDVEGKLKKSFIGRTSPGALRAAARGIVH